MLADYGADVVIADIRKQPRDDGTPTHELIEEETDRRATYVECDVTTYEDHLRAMDAAQDFGGVDVLVNNAGVLRPGELTELSEEDFDFIMDVNLKGVFFGSKAAAEQMDTGSIINISSDAAFVGQPGNSVYCASKAGVMLFTYAHAAELAPDIRVNAIHPGATETSMTTEDIDLIGSEGGEERLQDIPMERWGRPEDIAGTVVYLASDLASYVTAESILVEGGIVNTQ
jgi:NAD(P)-dependent dehydrogenase (short-subunit alcohol dehydrogenase family)